MQVFKTFFKIVKHNLGSICLYFIIFAGIFLAMAKLANTSPTTNFTASKNDIAVIDRDNSSYSKDLTAYLGSIHKLNKLEDDTSVMQDDLYFRNVVYILIIPKGFGEKIAGGNFEHQLQNVKVPDSFTGTYIDNQINQYLSTLRCYLSAGYKQDAALKATSDVLSAETTVNMTTKAKTSSSEGITYYFQYFAYVILCMIMIGLGPILIRFNNKDLKDRMDASALSLKKRNMVLISSSMLFSFLCWILFMLLGIIVFQSEFFCRQGLLSILNSFLFMLICVSLTFFVSTFAKNADSIDMISNTVGLGMSFLCGVFVPTEFMSASVLNLSRILPAYWYVNANNRFYNYIQSDTGLNKILIDFGVELFFAILFIGLGIFITKHKQKKLLAR